MTSLKFVGITEEVHPATYMLLFLLTPILLFFFLASVLSMNLLGILCCTGIEALLIYYSRSKGIMIDFEQNLYQNYTSFLGVRSGQWQSLPQFTDIVLFQYVSRVTKQNRRGWGKTSYKEISYRVTLYNPQTDAVLMVVNIGNEQKAHKQALILSQRLDLPLKIHESMI